MDIFDFMGSHPLLTFCLCYMLTKTVFRIVNRCLRSVNIALRGWPPEHVDADGDFKPEPEKKDDSDATTK